MTTQKVTTPTLCCITNALQDWQLPIPTILDCTMYNNSCSTTKTSVSHAMKGVSLAMLLLWLHTLKPSKITMGHDNSPVVKVPASSRGRVLPAESWQHPSIPRWVAFRSVITFFSPTSYKSAPFFRQENGKFFILHCHGIHYQIVSFTIIIRVGCVRSAPALTRATATSPWLFLTVSTTADRFFTVQHGHFRSLFQQEVDNLRGVRLVPPPRDPIITWQKPGYHTKSLYCPTRTSFTFPKSRCQHGQSRNSLRCDDVRHLPILHLYD